jgi:ComF family protein
MALIDVLLPPSCAGCGRYGSPLCDACRASFRPASPAADRFWVGDAGVVVGDALTLAISAFRYEGPLRRVLQRLKYGGAGRLASPLATAALPAFDDLTAVCGPLSLVPVPVHPVRLRERGYNQAALLARRIAAHRPRLVLELLVRSRATTKQHHLDRAARLRNLRDAFALRDAARPPPRVILVDDILTTSATLEACATTLLAAGCDQVYGFTLAREV